MEPETRARIIVKAAAIARRRVYELSAWQCFEESKSWIEAYADVCEAIDFMDFYGRGGHSPRRPPSRHAVSRARTTKFATFRWASAS